MAHESIGLFAKAAAYANLVERGFPSSLPMRVSSTREFKIMVAIERNKVSPFLAVEEILGCKPRINKEELSTLVTESLSLL